MLRLKHSPQRLITGLLSVCFLFIVSIGFAQPITTSGPPPSFLQMITNVVSNGGAISNISVLCDTLNVNGTGFQMGAFASAPPSNLGLTNGILLTSGSILNAPGPNANSGISTPVGGGFPNPSAPGDPDLDAIIAPQTTNDACVIEFDYIPTCDTFGIQYVFGSDEYLEFVASINDVFAFLITGPNPAGGNYTNQNIALVPGTGQPVSIANVNDVTNAIYYVDNGDGTTPALNPFVEYDGFTVPLVASAWVTPGQSYHIKIAVADASDDILDSGVFLQTLSCLQPTILTANQLQPSIEGCKPGIIQFTVTGHDPSQPFTFNYVVIGSATAGVDFAPLSGTYTIPAGQSQGTLAIPTFGDGLAEGLETIQLNITYPSGAGFGNATVTVNVTDEFSVVASANPAAVCGAGGSSVLSTNVANPAGYSFYWDFNGALTPTTTAFPVVGNNTYLVTATDPQGCVDTSSVTVPISTPVTASLAVPDSICINSANNITYTGTYTNNVTTLSWDFGGAVVVNGGTGLGPHTVSWTTPGTYTVCVTAINAGCPPSTACKQVVVLAPPVASIQPVADQCLDGNNFNFSFTGTANFNSIFWDFGSSAVPPNMTGTPFAAGIQYQNPGPKIVTVFVNKYGCSSNLASITFDVLEEPDANFVIGNGAVCQGGCLSFNYSGVLISDPSLMTYSWDFGPDANPQFSTLDSVPCVVFNSPGAHSIKLLVTNSGICKDSLVQSVFVHPNPQVTAGIDRSFCDGSGPIQLDASVSGGTPNTTTPNYYYSWWSNPAQGGISNPAVEDPQVNPLANCVEYYFQVQDVVGCRSNIDTAEVCVLPLPLASAGGDRIVCAGTSAPGDFLNGGIATNNQAPLPMTYSWYPTTGMAAGQGSVPNPYVNPGTTTIYTLFLTSANGCTSVTTTLDTVSTTTVTVNPVPLVNAGPHKEICYLDNVLLEGYASGAGPNYSYQWSPNDPTAGFANAAAAQVQTPTVAPQFTHIYTLEVTSNGCKASDTVSVTVHTLPTASIEPPSTDICQGQSITLNGLADGDPTGVLYGYSWSPSTGLSTNSQGITVASPLTTTSYNLYVSSQYCDGFADAIQVIVNPTPTPFISQIDTLLCYGDTIHLHSYYNFNGTGPTANPILYEWSPAEGLSDAFISNPIAEPTQTTTYYVSISVAGQCPKKDSVTFIVTPPINAQITADTTLICSAGSTTLTASGGSGSPAYSWSPATLVSDATSQVTTATPTTTTTYTLTITEGFCSDTDNVTIQVNRSPVADYVASHNRGCDTLLVNFMEQAQYETQYIWNFGDGSPTVNEPNPTHLYTQAGTYPVSLTVTGPGGCQDVAIMDTVYITDAVGNAGFTSSVAVNQPLVTPDAVIDFVDTSHHSISWLWDFGDGTTSSDPNPTHTYQNEGEYTVTLTVMNEDGCITSVTKTPYTVVAPGLNVPNVFTPNGDGSYDTWQVVYNGKEDILIEVFDRWGTPLFSSNTTQKAWNGADKRGFQLNDGVYFYSIKVGKKIYTGNVTIVK